MDDEEVSYASIGEPLYRVEAGNIEYRYTMGSILLLNRIWIWIKKMDDKEISYASISSRTTLQSRSGKYQIQV